MPFHDGSKWNDARAPGADLLKPFFGQIEILEVA